MHRDFTNSKLAATEVAVRNESHYIEVESETGGREIGIVGLQHNCASCTKGKCQNIA
jgi:hypothetical protein